MHREIHCNSQHEMQWLGGQAMEEVKVGFCAKGFSQLLRAADGTHFLMKLSQGYGPILALT